MVSDRVGAKFKITHEFISIMLGVRRSGVTLAIQLLEGKALIRNSWDGLPEYDYAVTVTRATAPDRYEIYTATLAKRLPKFKVPLAPDDRDTLLDLQAAFSRAYDLGSFAAQIDYKGPPPPDVPLNDEQRKWIDDTLKQQKMR